MKNKKFLMIALYSLFAVSIAVGLVNLFRKDKNERKHIQENYIEVQAKVNRVMRSGNRNKQATLLQIEFMCENEKQNATIRRNGYKENRYNAGDSITIYINPENKSDIK